MIVAIACIAVAVATALSFAADWRLELLSHFRPHLAAAAATLALLVLVADVSPGLKLVVFLVALAAACINLREIVRAVPRTAPVAAGRRLRIGFANVQNSNTQHSRVIDWVRREGVDVFVAAETLRAWPAALDVLRAELPFVAVQPPGDVTIFSRRRIVGEPFCVTTANSQLIAADLGGITVIGVHAASPQTAARRLERDAMIAAAADKVASSVGPVIVVGDFNAAPWSRPILTLVARTGLGYGPGARRGTFPARLRGLGLPRWAGIPIDLVMARGATVVACRLGPRIGSDHWPVLAELAWPVLEGASAHDGRASDASM